ncbi:MAG: peptidase MA family metallohydrolase [Dehalococcoidia bacterium]
MSRIAALALAFILVALASVSIAGAQSGIDVSDVHATSDFPNGISFSVTASADAGFDEVVLRYSIAPDGVRTTVVPECTAGAVMTCRYDLEAGARTALIPGAEITYLWSLTSGGVTQETEPQLIMYEDSRFEWQTISNGNLTVWFYDASEDEARGILQAGRESLDNIGALLETSVGFPVKIFYYRTAEEMQPAILSSDAGGVVTLGEVVYSDTAMVSADEAPGDITRHEIAHIVVREALGRRAGIPDWLHEGIAVYAQLQPLPDQRRAVDLAIESGDIISVRSLSSSSSGALSSRVSLFYGQSWSLVQFLVDMHGQEQFAAFVRAFKDGAATGDALQEVYGFDQDGLENAWRESVGLPPRDVPEPADPQQEPTPNPTADDTVEPDDDGGLPVVIIIVIIAVTAVLAGGLVLAAVALYRRYGG